MKEYVELGSFFLKSTQGRKRGKEKKKGCFLKEDKKKKKRKKQLAAKKAGKNKKIMRVRKKDSVRYSNFFPSPSNSGRDL